MSIFNDDNSISNIICALSSVQGNVKINGFIRIDGDIDGNLEASGSVVVGENAHINGNITAKSITVGGIVKGDIIAPDFVHLLSSSAVIGDIQTKKLQADENVFLQGHCISIFDDFSFSKAVERHNDIKTISQKSVRIPEKSARIPERNKDGS